MVVVVGPHSPDRYTMAREREEVNRAEIAGGSSSREGGAIMSETTNKFSPEVRARAVRHLLPGRRTSIAVGGD